MLLSTDRSISLRKTIRDYELYVLDLDGTLYFQPSFRFAMMGMLVKYVLFNPAKIKELIVVLKYRKKREKWEDESGDIDQKIYEKISKEMNISTYEIKKIIEFHMLEEPLSILKKYKDRNLEEFIILCRENGKKVAIYSDYPVENKMKALDIDVDYMFSSNDKEIDCLKPNPKGLHYILNKLGYDEKDVVMIGDRYEKDAIAAINCNIDYIVLPRTKRKRKKAYKRLQIK